MSNISVIRSLIQDKPVPQSQTIVGDGDTTIFYLTEFPVVAGSVNFTNAPPDFTLDEETGAITFESAPDVNSYGGKYSSVLLSDATLQDFIDLEGVESGNDIRFAAADALDAMAINQALLLRKIKMLDLETDGPAMAKALQAAAKIMRDMIQEDGSFDIAEQINDGPAFQEKILKDFMRGL